MNLTSEDFQRYVRIALQWLASFLVTRGMITPDASWLEPTIGVCVALASLGWTIYGNRINAKIAEVAKSPTVDKVVLNKPEVAAAIPSDKVIHWAS
jgi:hypothetical protein